MERAMTGKTAARRMVVAAGAAIAACCVLGTLRVHAQEAGRGDPGQAIERLEARIDGLQARQEQAQRETAARLDRILVNQEKMLKELEIIKVRTSLKS